MCAVVALSGDGGWHSWLIDTSAVSPQKLVLSFARTNRVPCNNAHLEMALHKSLCVGPLKGSDISLHWCTNSKQHAHNVHNPFSIP